MTQFKDKSARQGADRASVGLFTYPILQAADILLYQADAVPVGEDQRQHLELTRDLAQRFNTPLRPDLHRARSRTSSRPPRRSSTCRSPTAKMSKSASAAGRHRRACSTTRKARRKKIRSAVTDTGREIVFDPENKPGVSQPADDLLRAVRSVRRGARRRRTQGKGYGDLKKDLSEVVADFVAPIQQRTRGYLDDPAQLDKLLGIGAEKARSVASVTLRDVYEKVGFLAPARNG